jgi:membrane-bound lytic murein transglycosylase MltF
MPWPQRAFEWRALVESCVLGKDYSAELIAAIIDRESHWDPNIIGDGGHGHGLGQIDSRSWGPWLDANNWRDPNVSIPKIVEIFDEGYDILGDVPSAVAAYNCGPSRVRRMMANFIHPPIEALDTLTTGRNYVSWVFDRMAEFEAPLELEG